MKTADSIHKITIAAVMRSAMDINSWKYSKVVRERAHSLEREFNLSINELVVFEIRYSESVTLITTQRIIGKGGDKIIEINFDQIDDVVYGNFKGHLGESELSKFRIIDLRGDYYDFQFETGKASVGLMKSINTILKLTKGASI